MPPTSLLDIRAGIDYCLGMYLMGASRLQPAGVLGSNSKGTDMNRAGKPRKQYQTTGRKQAHHLRSKCIERIERREARIQWGV